MSKKTIRCKFKCNGINETETYVRDSKTNTGGMKSVFTASFYVVTGESEENKKFFLATPSGELKVGLHADKEFVVGKEYFIDITPAE